MLLLLAAVIAGCGKETPAIVPPPSGSNALAMAVAWKQTAADYEALYVQAFNVARMHVDRARRDGRRKLAVISDLDDTVLDTRDSWREVLAANEQLFSASLWAAWVAK